VLLVVLGVTPRPGGRRRATLVTPVAVPLTMAVTFALLRRRLEPRLAYNAGFAVYWFGWCAAFPLWVLGPRGVARVLRDGRRPGAADVALTALPVAGAVAVELLPHRRLVDREVAAVMVGCAVVNAVGEELLWRGTFQAQFPDDVVRGALWPLAGFTLWHLAPQLILPSPRGRVRFLLGAAVVGAASTAGAWRTGGLRAVLLPHVLTDACGVRAARFRLGR
jgi:membrane protease YdiL (CAAX protease family)